MSRAVDGLPANVHTAVQGPVPRLLPHARADVLRCHVLQRPVWQALALQDLAHMSQGGPSERWRRSAIFDDESGQCWSTVVQHCLGEVLPHSHPCRHVQMPWLWEGHIELSVCKHSWLHVAQVEEMVSRTAAGLPQSSKPVEKKPAAAPIWNMHAASFKVISIACLIAWLAPSCDQACEVLPCQSPLTIGKLTMHLTEPSEICLGACLCVSTGLWRRQQGAGAGAELSEVALLARHAERAQPQQPLRGLPLRGPPRHSAAGAAEPRSVWSHSTG